jgi:hypothetical protein
MKLTELSKLTGFSPGRIRQWILYNKIPIPGHRVTKGGHHRFTKCAGLDAFISECVEEKSKRAAKKKKSEVWGAAKEKIAKIQNEELPSIHVPKILRSLLYVAEWASRNGNEIRSWPIQRQEMLEQELRPVVMIYEQLKNSISDRGQSQTSFSRRRQ